MHWMVSTVARADPRDRARQLLDPRGQLAADLVRHGDSRRRDAANVFGQVVGRTVGPGERGEYQEQRESAAKRDHGGILEGESDRAAMLPPWPGCDKLWACLLGR